MKKLLFAFGLFMSLLGKAQTVTIPDPAFAAWIQGSYPSCISGNQLDTACINGLNILNIYIAYSNITNLFGIHLFVDLQNLTIRNNYGNLNTIPSLPNSLKTIYITDNSSLTNLPALPNSLLTLNCSNNNLTSLPTLPNSLQSFGCAKNNLTSLPPLPNLLTELYCGDNNLMNLPTLPNSLLELNCSNNNLSILPTLPNSLQGLGCAKNNLTSLPTLPNSLIRLSCDENNLTNLPVLPNSLMVFSCSKNNLTNLPTLPNSLVTLYCESNNLSSVPTLPPQLLYFNCDTNSLISLPTLPISLNSLNCNNNNLINLPNIPNSLSLLSCNNNNLISLPNMPNSIGYLSCNNNNLTSLPVSINSISALSCSNNNLTSLPYLSNCNYLNCANNNITYIPNLPNSLNSVDVSNNPNLVCLPKIPTDSFVNLNINNTGITCIQNYSNYINIPVCQFNSTNNPNNCPAVNVSGTVYLDQNNDCLYNWEPPTQNIPIMITNNSTMSSQQSNTNYIGHFEFIDIPLGTYTIKPDSIPIFLQSCIPNHTITLNTANPDTSGLNFGLQCKPNVFDLGVKNVLPVGPVFPGQQHTLKVQAGDLSKFYNFNCAASQNISATVTINVSGPVQYVSPAANALTPTNISGNVLTYAISNISTTNLFSSFNSIFTTDTTAQAGDSVCVLVTITTTQSGDVDPLNNTLKFCYLVVNSFDPNIKVVNREVVKPNFSDWLTYTIYFQNTGNAPAYNIKLVDTLDNALDLNTFEVIGYSHQNSFILNSNSRRLQVSYPNILLPDSFSNPLGSIGYIQYRIKPSAPMALNNQIKNKASIYFDFNAPIVTNTVTTIASNSLGLTGIKNKDEVMQLQPNPASQSLQVTLGKEKMDHICITELSGKVLLKKKVNAGDSKIYFDLSEIENGLYLVNGYMGDKIVRGKKLVVSK